MGKSEKKNSHGKCVEVELFQQPYQGAGLQEFFFVPSVIFHDRTWSEAHAMEIKAGVRKPQEQCVHEKAPNDGFQEAIARPLTSNHETQNLLPFGQQNAVDGDGTRHGVPNGTRGQRAPSNGVNRLAWL